MTILWLWMLLCAAISCASLCSIAITLKKAADDKTGEAQLNRLIQAYEDTRAQVDKRWKMTQAHMVQCEARYQARMRTEPPKAQES